MIKQSKLWVRLWPRRTVVAALCAALAINMVLVLVAAHAASPSALEGDWLTHDGSIVRTAACTADAICITVVKVNPQAPATEDRHNPDRALRTRALCGLQIGSGFKPEGADTASGGSLYDPVSGKTYSGRISLDGDRLKLRGYIGVPLFGRTETWTRVPAISACK